MNLDLPVVAGSISTVLFALGTLPMLIKAARTKDLSSYSIGNIALSNLANVIHSVYVFQLPPGPVWALHAFHMVSTGLMLLWYLRYSATRAHIRRTTHECRQPTCTISPTRHPPTAPSVVADVLSHAS
jgi:uncharacterized protein with PQ loop repeat